jgi:hypothetical protein
MGGGVQGRIKDLPGSRGASVEFRPIPGGDSFLPEKIRRGGTLGNAEGGNKKHRGKDKADPFHTPIIGEKMKYPLDISYSPEYVLL